MLCALIMAGGRGERFWPLSTDDKPKQFLKLIGDKTMLQMTVDRIKRVIPMDRIFIVTGKVYTELVKEQLPDILERNIIVEPIGRNTAPCIALSAKYIKGIYEDSVLAVLPSDHLVKNDERFNEILLEGYKFVKEKPENIITIGITPDRPETGYGYIKYSNEEDKAAANDAAIDAENSIIMPVEAFIEKPNLEKAKEYLEDGKYLWNAGMFIWNIDNILNLTQKHLPDTYKIIESIEVDEKVFNEECNEKYPLVENISVDYGIMEKTENIYVIPGDFGWDDVGSWFAIERYSDKDENNNVHKGNISSIDSKDNLVISTQKPIVVVGAEELLIVESDDLIFVCKKDQIKNIREIKKTIVSK
ncbi:mannose-1-phosphate guanylyltransferase [Clostridium sp. 19966]|uniref:mannose-1-phosphate guanylyltransferase n=1 Tax=Clostridium sp. 19966 TaxID=2768166 RepID=UPI0028DD94DD|nr:mannose-1-phosphate guanylyltransferase [Clostridium sp. 19966]MDT8716157.1 mannose-1-phosphate guanylyltransferase [Clostridium sp. 19966]